MRADAYANRSLGAAHGAGRAGCCGPRHKPVRPSPNSALFSARRWAKIALIAILPIYISICDSDSLAGTQNAQNEASRMAFFENVSIPNSTIDHAALDHIPQASDSSEMTGRVRFQRLSAEPSETAMLKMPPNLIVREALKTIPSHKLRGT